MSVEPGSARWKELVARGIIKDGQRNWFLGDAALEIAPMGDTQANNGALAILRQYSDEIGVEYESIMQYRRVADSWSHSNRVLSTPWKVHQMLANRQDLIRPEMTVSRAALALGQKNTGRTGPNSTVQEQVKAVREYLRNPEVAQMVMSDGSAVTALREALKVVHPKPPRPEPEPEHLPSVADVRAWLAQIQQHYRRTQRALLVADFQPGDAQLILGDITENDELADQCKAELTGARVEEVIDRILQEETR